MAETTLTYRVFPTPKPNTATLRRLAVEHNVDERTIVKELLNPGSVRGAAGERAAEAVAAWQADPRRA